MTKKSIWLFLFAKNADMLGFLASHGDTVGLYQFRATTSAGIAHVNKAVCDNIYGKCTKRSSRTGTEARKKNASEEVQAARGKTRQYERMPEFPWVMRVLRDLRLHRTFANMKAKTSEYMAKGILCLLISQHRDAMEIMTKIEAPMPGVGRGVKAPSFGKVLKAAAKYRDECKSWGPLPRLPRASASLTLNRLLPRRVRTSDLLTILVAEFLVGV